MTTGLDSWHKIDWQELCKQNFERSSVETIVEVCGVEILFDADRKGYFPIHWATIANKSDVVEYMIECGVPVDVRARSREEPECLHLAAMEGYPEVIDILIMHGARVNAKDNSGCTPLMRAALFGYNDEIKSSETVMHLISRGADPFEIDKCGMSALHYATLRNNEETVHLLLTIGLSPNLRNKNHLKPFHIAFYNGNTNLIRTLRPLTAGIRDEDLNKLHHRKSMRETLDEAFTLAARVFIVACFLGAIGWAYPQYAFYYYPRTNHYLILHTMLLVSSTLFWFSWYKTMFTDPGYLPKNSAEYHTKLQTRLALASRRKSLKWLPADPCKGVKLCHTCKTVQPVRSKHCRFCDRCTARFDHHCVYLKSCIGERNRIAFFGLISNMLITGLTYALIILIAVRQDNWNFTPYHLSHLSYCFKLIVVGGIMTFTTIRRAAVNLTQNEEVRATTYRYLRNRSGQFHNPFDKGIVKNLADYFELNLAPCRERLTI